jgi:WD40 repeat protein
MLEPEGSQPTLMVDNAAADPAAVDYVTTQRLSDAHFSPDGRFLAYALNGLWILDLSNNESVHLLNNEIDEDASIDTYYLPLAWAPNSLQLLLASGGPAQSSLAFLNPGQERLVTRVDFEGNACCQVAWSPDSGSALLASPYGGLVEHGLWRLDALSGGTERLLPAEVDGLLQFAGWPLELPDGTLQYFYASAADLPEGDLPLFMVRSNADGVSERSQLRQDAFGSLGEVLWAPDGSLALVVQLRPDGGRGGAVLLAPAGDQQLQLLLDDGYMLRWGE